MQRTQGPPSPNLPNLDEARRQQPKAPKAHDPIPSTKCSHHDLPCKAEKEKKASLLPLNSDGRERLVARADGLSRSDRQAGFTGTSKGGFSIPSLEAWLGNLNRPIYDLPVGQQPRPQNLTALTAAALPARSNNSTLMASNAALQSGPSTSDLAVARLDPNNRTGTPGEDLLSRNFNWSLPLLGLAGRAGLDLGLSLSYNSLVWTKANSWITYDVDRGFPGPGFKLGFPVIEGTYFNPQVGSNAYLMTMPSGQRVELRQVGSANVYESADASYLQLTADYIYMILTVRAADGTQLKYVPGSSHWNCVEVKDRNGNYLTVTYTSFDGINTITDTLGRVVTFNYDTYNHVLSITQPWNGQPHTWATFGYTNLTLQTNFTGVSLYGTPNGTVIPTLTQVSLADGSRYNFDYTSWGQVKTIHRWADTLERASTTYNLPVDASTAQTDCPRFTQRTDYAYEWNTVQSTYSFDPGGAWGQVTAPDGTIYKEYFATSGWQRGLTTQAEVYSSDAPPPSTPKKKTIITWTQDNTGISYFLNPRVTETNIYDDVNNRRRATTSYLTFALPSGTNCSLPTDIYEYDTNGTTLLRRTHRDYNLSATYISATRRLIGLLSAQYLYDGGGALFSKVDYQYDWSGGFLVSQGPPVRHDKTNYGASFVQGRGNLCSVRRWDVNFPTDITKVAEYQKGYNTAGSVIFQSDPLGHQTDISYADSFSDGNNTRNTYAYATKVTDPDGRVANPQYFSTTQYHFDLGLVTRTETPKRAQDTSGMIKTYTYDAAGRPDRVTNQLNSAYTRYVYAANQYYVQSFATVNDLATEFYAITIFDGADRVRAVASDHPTSVSLYKAQYNVYDPVGRLAQQSNPTEINSSWAPAGDDPAWVWNKQDYDWKGRPTVTTKAYQTPDQTVQQISYGGCGCAGGEVATLIDEVGRRQRRTQDVLGRVVKVEVLNLDAPVYSTYATTTNTYNVRDQITSVKQYQGTATGDGSCPINTCQETWTNYDGHGRVYQAKQVIESGPRTYTYYNDDRLYTATDARGVTATYTWYGRPLVKDVTYSGGVSVQPSDPVHYEYDAAGNRTKMTDELGQVDYGYDILSRMTAETRTFSNLAAYSPSNFISYNNVISVCTLGYEYNLTGQLTKITDPWQGSVSYQHDKTGQVTSVTANGYGNYDAFNATPITNIVSGVKNRAWGAVKQLDTGTVASLAHFDYSYNLRQFLTQLNQGGRVTAHTYYDDRKIRDVTNSTRPGFNLHHEYDQVGRLRLAKAGNDPDWTKNPYFFLYKYNAFGDATKRTGDLNETPPGTTPAHHWSQSLPDFDASFTNHRDSSLTYDESGQLTGGGYYKYNQAGNLRIQKTDTHLSPPYLTYRHRSDGDGHRLYSNNYCNCSALGAQTSLPA